MAQNIASKPGKRKYLVSGVPASVRGKVAVRDADNEPTEQENAALMLAFDELEQALNSALVQAKRNLFHLRDARLEVETARDIAAASNKRAAGEAVGQ